MLTDRFNRTIRYLRLSVMDRCNLRCTYCLPKRFKDFKEPSRWLNFDQIARVVGAFVRLGVDHVRITGGEPLLRRNLPELAKQLATLPGLTDLSLTTNATQLVRFAKPLYMAGVKRLNVSIDSLRRDCMQQITGSDSLQQVMDGLMVAKTVGFSPIKLNMVVLAGVNDGDIESMADFCIQEGFILRLIEAMPVGQSGRSAGFVNLQPILEHLKARYQLVPLTQELGGGPARYWRTSDGQFTIGIITPISQHFCASCNRVRLSVDGVLYSCLGQNSALPLKPILENHDDEVLTEAIYHAIWQKPERHEFIEEPTKIVRFMSALGG
ncbi:MAG: GTP 3',8-cyclase MoaA [Neisseriales bacterium]|nr:MAG: GTP 3',8-cyclase MoaA [Neisseriales bacterium]